MININIQKDFKKISTKNKFIKELINNIFNTYKINKAEISIILTSRNYLSELKKRYFNIDQFTDVLAFNISDNIDCLEGEIYISIDDVKENSKIFSKTFNNEFTRILIHGVLHLVGFNDKTKNEKKEMQLLEDKFLSTFDKVIII